MKGSELSRKVFVCFLITFAVSVLSWSLTPLVVQAQKTEIRYMNFIDPTKEGPRSEALRQIIANFEKKYPQYKVVNDIVPWAEVDKILISAVASGKGPDVVRISSQVLGQHIPAKTIIPLDPFCSKWTQAQRSDFISPWDFTAWDGKKMAFFLEHRMAVLYYREDYLMKAGFDKPPKALDELVKVAGAVQKTNPNVAGFAIGLSSKRRAATLMELIPSLIFGAGGEVLDSKGKAVYNSPVGVKIFQFIKDLVTKYEVMPKSTVAYTYDDIHSGFQSGTIGIGCLGSHRYVDIRSGMKPEVQKYFKTAPIPGFEKPSPAVMIGWTMAITSVCKNPEAAWRFVEHMISPESQAINARVAGELPSRKSSFNDSWFNTDEAAHMRVWKDYVINHGKFFKFPEKSTEMAEGWGKLSRRPFYRMPM